MESMPTQMNPRRGRSLESGAVTAEASMVIAVLAVIAVAMSFLISLGITQVRVMDAAREGARVVARGESEATGAALARKVAGTEAEVSISTTAETVTVMVRRRVNGPGGVLSHAHLGSLESTSVAALEPELSP